MKKPQDVVSVSRPEIFIDHARLILKEDIFETAEQADSEVTELSKFIFVELIGAYHPDTEDACEFLAAANYRGHFSEGRSRQLIGLGMGGQRVS